jgi:hypothetical protein
MKSFHILVLDNYLWYLLPRRSYPVLHPPRFTRGYHRMPCASRPNKRGSCWVARAAATAAPCAACAAALAAAAASMLRIMVRITAPRLGSRDGLNANP